MADKQKIVEFPAELFVHEEHAKVYAGEYTIQQWDWGMQQDAIDDSTGIDFVTGLPVVKSGTMNRAMLAKCVAKAPFRHTVGNPNMKLIRKMPPQVGNVLLVEIRLLNKSITRERKKNSKGSQKTPT